MVVVLIFGKLFREKSSSFVFDSLGCFLSSLHNAMCLYCDNVWDLHFFGDHPVIES